MILPKSFGIFGSSSNIGIRIRICMSIYFFRFMLYHFFPIVFDYMLDMARAHN